ncbi:MAG TPA: GNAT family N-acetyltransferase [Kribbellaceae bacterium]
MVFETERLVVRDWDESDGDRVFDIYRRWEVSRWLGAEPKVMPDRAAASAAIARWRERSADPSYGVWAVEECATGVVAGTVLLVPLPNVDGEVEVGWHFHPDAWGRRLATEAARGALDRGWAAGLDEIYAVVLPGNDPSAAVCRRLGMRPLGSTTRWYGVEMDAFVVRNGDPGAAG